MSLACCSVASTPISQNAASLSWSNEGQVALVTKYNLHILTPSIGLVVDSPPVHSGLPNVFSGKDPPTGQIGWFQTGIPIDLAYEISWDYYTNDPRVNPIGAQDPGWHRAVFSPTGLSLIGSSLIAGLTTNREVFIFMAPKDAKRGKYEKTFDVTLTLLKMLMPPFDTVREENADYRASINKLCLHCQSTTLAWSKACSSASGNELSLFVTGQASGHLVFWRTKDEGQMKPIGRYRNKSEWILNLTFSTWQFRKSTATAYLAFTTSSGYLGILRITQDLNTSDRDTDFVSEGMPDSLDVELVVEVIPEDARQISYLHFMDFGKKNDQLVLLWAKLGQVYVGKVPDKASPGSFSSLECLNLVALSNWAGQTPFANCVGIVQLNLDDALFITSDGSMHAVLCCRTEPRYDVTRSKEITEHVRQNFVATESAITKTKIDRSYFMATYAVASCGFPCNLLLSAYELERPRHKLYKPPAMLITQILLSHQHNVHPPLELGVILSDLLNAHQSSIDYTALCFCLPFLCSLPVDQNPATELLDLLENGTVTLPVLTEFASFYQLFSAVFRADQDLGRLRLRCFIADVWSRRSARRDENLGRITRNLTDQLSYCIISRLELLAQSMRGLTNLFPADESYISLLSTASSWLNSRSVIDQSNLGAEQETQQKCPACKEDIPLQDLSQATCRKGHIFDRCSISLQIIDTTFMRTCTSCGRKALLGDSSTADGLLNQILISCRQCLYCNGTFVSFN